jgi:vesicle-fusing ATPase
MATTSQRSVMEQLDLAPLFDREIAVPPVKDGRELATVLSASNAFANPGDVNEAINLVRSWRNDGSPELHVGVGIKRILSLVEDAKLSADPLQSFAEQMAMQITRANPV